MNIQITSTAEALVQEIMALGYDNPEIIIEEALKSFHVQQLAIKESTSAVELDTTLGFAELTEAEVIQANEQRWQTFQHTGNSLSQEQIESWAASLGSDKRS